MRSMRARRVSSSSGSGSRGDAPMGYGCVYIPPWLDGGTIPLRRR